jgi:hypothetical protein
VNKHSNHSSSVTFFQLFVTLCYSITLALHFDDTLQRIVTPPTPSAQKYQINANSSSLGHEVSVETMLMPPAAKHNRNVKAGHVITTNGRFCITSRAFSNATNWNKGY